MNFNLRHHLQTYSNLQSSVNQDVLFKNGFSAIHWPQSGHSLFLKNDRWTSFHTHCGFGQMMLVGLQFYCSPLSFRSFDLHLVASIVCLGESTPLKYNWAWKKICAYCLWKEGRSHIDKPAGLDYSSHHYKIVIWSKALRRVSGRLIRTILMIKLKLYWTVSTLSLFFF